MIPYYHSAFGAPFQLHMVYDSSDPWATAAAPVIQSELQAAGLDTTLLPVAGATQTGKVLAAGFADLAVLPQTFTPVHEPDGGHVHEAAGADGQERLAGLDGLLGQQVRPTGDDGLGATQPDHGHGLLHAGRHACCGTTWSRCPLFAEPTVLVWSRTIAGVNAEPRSTSLLWFAQYWAVKVPESTSNTTPSLPGP